MGERISPLAVGFGGEEGKVVRELAAGGRGSDMERLLVKNNGYGKLAYGPLPYGKVCQHTFRSETGVCKVLRLRLGLADLELWFLRKSVSQFVIMNTPLISPGSPFASPSFAWRWNPWLLLSIEVWGQLSQ